MIVEVSSEAEIDKAIENQIKAWAGMDEQDFLYFLSRHEVNKYKQGVINRALKTLEPADRERVERNMRTGAGLYGPISFLIGHVDAETNQLLLQTAQLKPDVDDGRSVFNSIWGRLKKQVCEDWHYCEKRKEFADEMKLWVAIIAIAVRAMSLEVAVATAVVLIAVHKGPKFICDCPE